MKLVNKKHWMWLVLLLCAFLSPESTHAAPKRSISSAMVSDPQYLIFQIFTASPGFRTEQNRHAISKLPEKSFIQNTVRDIVSRIDQDSTQGHRLGFSLGPLALDYSDEQLRTLVKWSFEIAREEGVAVVLHIDDSKFWMNRDDLWKKNENIEWKDWNQSANTGQFLNWGEVWKLAPQICFNSPEIVTEVYRISKDVIGAAVAKELEGLSQAEANSLFGGVIVGWETALGRDHDSRKSLGYCALTNRGFSRSNPPANKDDELEQVVAEWIGLWSGGIVDAGVPSNRVYSHTAAFSKKQYDEQHNTLALKAKQSFGEFVNFSPPASAFGRSHRAGFSIYPERDILNDVYGELQRHGNPPWASAEGTNVVINSGRPHIPSGSMENYLALMFNHGAKMVNVFGWGIPGSNPFKEATERPEALIAYRKFLQGIPLSEQSPQAAASESPVSQQNELANRVRGVHAKIRSYQQSGGNMKPVMQHMLRLEKAIANGDLDTIEKELNLVLEIVE